MSLFVIGDLHLSESVGKPMDIFGDVWKNAKEKIISGWKAEENDTVIIAGDFSWAMNFEELRADLSFVNGLNGKKVLIKGNHDYWWSTLKKLNGLREEFPTVSFLHNTSVTYGDISVCGTRGWSEEDDERNIGTREENRLRLSLLSAGKDEKIVVLHFPPTDGMIKVMTEFNVKRCFFGHLHGEKAAGFSEEPKSGIEMKLISADFLNFELYKII